MKLSLHKKVLLSLGVVAGIGALAGAGTFATFTARTTNPDNTFAAGTLVLSNDVTGGDPVCLSTNGGDTDSNENDCETILDLSVQAPGDSDTATLTLKNEGSLDASALKVFSGACAPADAADEDFHGTGNPCSVVQLYIQQFSDSGFTTPSACLYGGSSGNTCDFSDPAQTLATFAAAHTSAGTGVSAGSLDAGDSTWIEIGLMLPEDAGNTFQGRAAAMDLFWHITQ